MNKESKCIRLKESITLLSHLMLPDGYSYFDRFDVLDSDGRKLLARIGKLLAPVDKRLSFKVSRVLRDPTRDALAKLYEALLIEYEECRRSKV